MDGLLTCLGSDTPHQASFLILSSSPCWDEIFSCKDTPLPCLGSDIPGQPASDTLSSQMTPTSHTRSPPRVDTLFLHPSPETPILSCPTMWMPPLYHMVSDHLHHVWHSQLGSGFYAWALSMRTAPQISLFWAALLFHALLILLGLGLLDQAVHSQGNHPHLLVLGDNGPHGSSHSGTDIYLDQHHFMALALNFSGKEEIGRRR